MKASDALAKLLIAHQVQTCFELVGGMITHMLDSLAESGQFNIVSMHHEQSAAFAAEGVARYTKGKSIAVAMGTSGPGATNMITGIGDCWFDSVPCLFITGQVNTHELKGARGIRQQGFQELDIVEVVKSLTKYAVRVDSAETLLPELHKALSVAISGRQGPVLLDIPNDVQRFDIPDELVEKWVNIPLEIEAGPEASSAALQELASLCKDAQRPLICIGGGARWADGMDVGTLIMSGLKKDRVLDAVRIIISQYEQSKRVMPPVQDYETAIVSKQIIRVVHSYVDYVNRTVWSK